MHYICWQLTAALSCWLPRETAAGGIIHLEKILRFLLTGRDLLLCFCFSRIWSFVYFLKDNLWFQKRGIPLLLFLFLFCFWFILVGKRCHVVPRESRVIATVPNSSWCGALVNLFRFSLFSYVQTSGSVLTLEQALCFTFNRPNKRFILWLYDQKDHLNLAISKLCLIQFSLQMMNTTVSAAPVVPASLAAASSLGSVIVTGQELLLGHCRRQSQ